MPVQIDTDAEIDSIRMAEQAAAPATPAAGYFNAFMKETGLYWVDDAGIVAGPLGANFVPTGRLTLTTATPVTTADVTAAATLYYTPYNGNVITLYDGARWIPVVYTEKSLALGALTASKPYDIWGYLSSGTLALEALVWTNATTRATALAYQDGRLVKSGATTRLYLGSIYINSSGGQTDDALTKRNVFNYYNQKARRLYRTDANAHNYTTGAWQSWNADTTQILEYMCGVVESAMSLKLLNVNWGGAGANLSYVAMGLDVTNNTTADYPSISMNNSLTASVPRHAAASDMFPSLGYHFVGINEFGATSANFSQYFATGFVMG